MKRDKLYNRWLKYFLRRDIPSKLLVTLSVLSLIIWYTIFRNNEFLVFAAGLLLFSIAFSFLSYAIVGSQRIAAENKFYDSIYSACDFEPPYKGRIMSNVKVSWSGLKVHKVELMAPTASTMMTSDSHWRSAKMSVNDAFSMRGQVIASLDQQTRGF